MTNLKTLSHNFIYFKKKFSIQTILFILILAFSACGDDYDKVAVEGEIGVITFTNITPGSFIRGCVVSSNPNYSFGSPDSDAWYSSRIGSGYDHQNYYYDKFIIHPELYILLNGVWVQDYNMGGFFSYSGSCSVQIDFFDGNQKGTRNMRYSSKNSIR